MEPSKLLTVRAAAERLGVSPSLVYGLLAARKLEHIRIGLGRGVIRISEEGIAEYRRRNAVAVEDVAPASPEPISLTLKHLNL